MKFILPVLLGIILYLFSALPVKAEDPSVVCKPDCSPPQYCVSGVCQVPTCSDAIIQTCKLHANGIDYDKGSGYQACFQKMDDQTLKCSIDESTCSECRPSLSLCNPERNIAFCKGDLLYKTSECDQKFGGTDLLVEDCTKHNNSEGDWYCKGDDDKARCEREYQVDIKIVPNTNVLNLGEKYTIDIHGTKSCSSADFSPEVLGKIGSDGFADTSEFKQNCKIEFKGCLYDGDKPCRWQVTCVPTKMSKNGSDNFGFTFQAEGIKIDPASFGNKCKAEIKYTVGSRSCNLNASKPPEDKGGSDNNSLVGRTLNSTYVVVKAFNKALLPEELNKEIDSSVSASLPEIGVQEGFFGLLGGWLCDVAARIGLNGFSYCKTEVDLANKKTGHFVESSKPLANSQRPKEIVPTPMKKSCYLEDLKDNEINTSGDKKLDDLSTDIGVNDGVFGLGMPEFSDLNLDNQGSNLSIKKIPVKEDDRTPGIKCQEERFYQANYPEGIKPLYEVPSGAEVSGCLKK